MQYKLLLAALSVLGAAAPQIVNPFDCAAEEPSAEFLLAASLMQLEEALATPTASQDRTSQDRTSQASVSQASIVVDTYFHVVSSSTDAADGNVADSMLTQQLDAMNNAYAPHSIQFNLVSVDRTVNATWASDGDPMSMRRALHKGTYSSLNVYFEKSLGGSLGYCYLPITAAPNGTDFYRDGCAILYSTVPGGSLANYNQGMTTVHEVGHWFGLLHTFQGNSCASSNSGDMISDTPQQASASSGCPTGRDSCPDAAGLDPIHNYMDYSSDACYTEFTAAQEVRMYNMYNKFRAGK